MPRNENHTSWVVASILDKLGAEPFVYAPAALGPGDFSYYRDLGQQFYRAYMPFQETECNDDPSATFDAAGDRFSTLMQNHSPLVRYGDDVFEFVPDTEDAFVGQYRRLSPDDMLTLAGELVDNTTIRPPAESSSKVIPVLPSSPRHIKMVAETLVQLLPRMLDSRFNRATGRSLTADDRCIPFGNGTLTNLLTPSPTMVRPTMDQFDANPVRLQYNPHAPSPVNWLAFLDSIAPPECKADWITCLQEWFGYCLLPTCAAQKAMMLVGVPRSGKSTIMQILSDMLAPQAVDVSLGTVNDQFGLTAYVGKRLLRVPDAPSDLSLSRNMDSFFKRVIGEDGFTVGRKYRDPLDDVKFPAKIVVVSNILPEIRDETYSLFSKFLILHFPTSFAGSENRNLLHQLRSELPGITLWAVQGARRILRNHLQFTEVPASAQAARTIKNLNSPLESFLDEMTVQAFSARTPCLEVYEAYRGWCQANDVEPETIQGFGRQLRKIRPNLRKSLVLVGGKRVNHYVGMGFAPNTTIVIHENASCEPTSASQPVPAGSPKNTSAKSSESTLTDSNTSDAPSDCPPRSGAASGDTASSPSSPPSPTAPASAAPTSTTTTLPSNSILRNWRNASPVSSLISHSASHSTDIGT